MSGRRSPRDEPLSRVRHGFIGAMETRHSTLNLPNSNGQGAALPGS